MIDIRRVIAVALFCALGSQLVAAGKIIINLRQSDAAIRQQLLAPTPPGTTAKKVFQFLQFRLPRDRDSEIVSRPGQPHRSAMSIHLGHYHEPLSLFPTVVQAF
jgi:hypothetical protein